MRLISIGELIPSVRDVRTMDAPWTLGSSKNWRPRESNDAYVRRRPIRIILTQNSLVKRVVLEYLSTLSLDRSLFPDEQRPFFFVFFDVFIRCYFQERLLFRSSLLVFSLFELLMEHCWKFSPFLETELLKEKNASRREFSLPFK